MTTRMNTTINNSKKNRNSTSYIVSGLDGMSHAAFEQFNKIRTAYYNREDISNNWEYPSCFLVALYEHFQKTSPLDAEDVQSVIMSMNWLFDGAQYQTFYKNDEKPTTVTIKQYRGNEEVTPIEITSFDKAFEAIRDMCLPMVYNW